MKIELYDLMMSRRGMLKGCGRRWPPAPRSRHRCRGRRWRRRSACRHARRSPASARASRRMPIGRRSARCALAPPRRTCKEGEFKGVELSFMGLNNQNVHNVLFRGLSKAWADYTGATINWIDLAQADYNARLQQSIATGTVDFDVIEMGAPFEGDVCGKGLASEMPDWVKTQIDMDDYVGYLKAPGRHLGRQDLSHLLRRRLPQLQLPLRRVRRRGPRRGMEEGGRRTANGACRRPGSRSRPPPSSSRASSSTARTSTAISIPCKGWGGFGFYFLGTRATAYAKHPDDKAFLFDPDTMKPRVNNRGLGARHPGRARRAAVRAGRPAQRRSGHHGLPAVPRRHRLDAVVVGRHRLERQDQRHLGHQGDVTAFDILPGSDDVYNSKTGEWDKLASGPNYRAEHGLYRLGHLRDGPRRRRRRRSRRRPGRSPRISAARTSRCGWRPIRRASSPTARATSTCRSGSARATTRRSSRAILDSQANSYNHPERGDRAAHPRHLPVLLRGRGRTGQDLCRPGDGAGRRGHDRRRLGEDHRPARPRQPDQALQGLARHVSDDSGPAALTLPARFHFNGKSSRTADHDVRPPPPPPAATPLSAAVSPQPAADGQPAHPRRHAASRLLIADAERSMPPASFPSASPTGSRSSSPIALWGVALCAGPDPARRRSRLARAVRAAGRPVHRGAGHLPDLLRPLHRLHDWNLSLGRRPAVQRSRQLLPAHRRSLFLERARQHGVLRADGAGAVCHRLRLSRCC